MRAFKFLDAAGRAPFTGALWTAGEWIEARSAKACVEGVHACSVWDLSVWLADSLWEVELEGQVEHSRHKVVGSRGRLVRRIDDYPAAVRELHVEGAWRSRDRAVVALRAAGVDDLADRFSGVDSVASLAALEVEVDDLTHEGAAAALAADAAQFALRGDHAQSPFVAACSAGHVAAGPDGVQADYDRGYATERAFQSAWLAERLALA